MKYRYKTTGTCSQQIEFEIDNNILKNVVFYGGCQGNLQGISSLVEGMKVEDVVKRLEGIHCGMKSTSCPDQLATALKKVLEKNNNSEKNQ
ncbi:MAG: TIGR03905 family TSCPD domain-containing protein [Bacteroidales bacterium]|nr:TIGR03905 family TSCPD domain-containing protein [Bacteroidales bacterium]